MWNKHSARSSFFWVWSISACLRECHAFGMFFSPFLSFFNGSFSNGFNGLQYALKETCLSQKPNELTKHFDLRDYQSIILQNATKLTNDSWCSRFYFKLTTIHAILIDLRVNWTKPHKLKFDVKMELCQHVTHRINGFILQSHQSSSLPSRVAFCWVASLVRQVLSRHKTSQIDSM